MSAADGKTPHERLGELLSSFTDEELSEIDRTVADPDHAPEPVELLDDPDPLGRDWDWLEGHGDEENAQR